MIYTKNIKSGQFGEYRVPSSGFDLNSLIFMHYTRNSLNGMSILNFI